MARIAITSRKFAAGFVNPFCNEGAKTVQKSGAKSKAAKKAGADRSAIMRAVRSRDTGPERTVRALLRDIATGYRLNRRDLPGAPDIAFIRRKRAIFVHGCFWHGHDCARGARTPKANQAYWIEKIARNKSRDIRHERDLAAQGWRCLVVWECELKSPASVEAKLRAFLSDNNDEETIVARKRS